MLWAVPYVALVRILRSAGFNICFDNRYNPTSC